MRYLFLALAIPLAACASQQSRSGLGFGGASSRCVNLWAVDNPAIPVEQAMALATPPCPAGMTLVDKIAWDENLSKAERVRNLPTGQAQRIVDNNVLGSTVSGSDASSLPYAGAQSSPYGGAYVTRQDDPFRPTISLTVKPDIVVGSVQQVVWNSAMYTNATIGAFIDRQTQAVTIRAEVMVMHRSLTWNGFSSAGNIRAQPLQARRIHNDVNCSGTYRGGNCTYTEVVSVILPWADLDEAVRTDTPYQFKIFGRVSDAQITVPVGHIRALLDQEELKARAPALTPARRGSRPST